MEAMRLRLAMTALLLAVALPVGLAAPAQAGTPGDADDYRLADQALQALLASPLGQDLPRLPWKVQILESWQVNAYSNGRGQISITRGLGWVMGDHPGVWAAAIAHELAHAVMLYPAGQPQFEAELRRAYLAAGGNLSDPDVAEELRVTPAQGGLLRLAGQRRVEYEADRLGLLLMAEAGFHPDFAVALDRRMLSTIGEETKSSEFLLSHPIWSDRERRNVREETVPVAIFNQRWPDASRSPGGPPPPFGKVQSVTVTEGSAGGVLVLDVKFELRNAAGRKARVAAVLLDRNRKVRTSRAEYQAPDGTLALNAMLPAMDHGPGEATLRIPRDAIESGGTKLKAAVFLVADDWTLDLWFQPLKQ
jgi:Zn-dependent protease with chaperone function